jgi:predicted transcriptional regulator
MAEADSVFTRSDLPPQVEQLATRERELASLVYRSGGLTAKDLEQELSGPISNAAIRSMLVRLCDKKILKRRKLPMETDHCGKRVAYLYLPAIDDQAMKARVLKQVARDYFSGSLVKLMAHAADELLHQDGHLFRDPTGRR